MVLFLKCSILHAGNYSIKTISSKLQSGSVLYPSDPDSVGRLVCQSVNLDFPGLEDVKQYAAVANYSAALDAWKKYKVNSFRKSYMGPFGWHSNQLNSSTVLPYAQYMAGTISLTQFQASACSQKADFQLFNFSASAGIPFSANWLSQNASGIYPNVYSNFYNIIPLASHYFKSTELVYLQKWFHLTADFACRQKLLIDKIAAAGQSTLPYNNCNWSTNAAVALSQGDRVFNIIRGLGVVCKSLPNGNKPALWDSIYVPLNNSLPESSVNLIPSVQLAQISFSLVFDHPKALQDRYLTVGAVPNQRRNGLAALLFIATQFPEFLVSSEIMTKASAGFDDYLNGAFFTDGGMLEPSLNYNMGDAASLGDLYLLLKNLQPALANKIKDKQMAFYEFSSKIRTPLGNLPAMSSQSPSNPTAVWSNESNRISWMNSAYLTIPERTDLRISPVASMFKPDNNTIAPNFNSVQYPYSGFYVQRDNWKWDSKYLFFQAHRPARGHTNLGRNAIQVQAYGRPLLVTAGAPVYDTTQLAVEFKPDLDAINNFLGENTTLKTNTIIVDVKSQSAGNVAQTVYTEPINARWHNSSNFDFLEGYYDLGYPTAGSVNHRRMVTYVRNPGFWIVADIMTNVDQQNHTFTQIWNFPGFQSDGTTAYGFKQNEILTDATGIHTADPTGPNLWLYHVGEKPLSYSTYFGQRNPYRGWFSPSFGKLIPAPQVFSTWSSSKNSTLITIIWPVATNSNPEFSNFQNLSTSTNPDFAGFKMTLSDGRILNYQVAHDSRIFSNDYSSTVSQSSLTVTMPNGDGTGLVVGQTVKEYGFKNGDLTNSVDTSFNNSVKIFPNPFSSELNFRSAIKIQKYEIFNLLGTLVFKEDNPKNVLNLSFLKQGTYFLKCFTENFNSTQILIKK